MRAHKLAALWLSGDTGMRDREVAQEFVLRVALRDPVRSAEIVAELNDGSRSLTCGKFFAMSMRDYRENPAAWRDSVRQQCRRQRQIDACRRSRPYGRLVA